MVMGASQAKMPSLALSVSRGMMTTIHHNQPYHMYNPDLDLHDTDELLNDLGYTNLDPMPAHLDPDRLSPCNAYSNTDLFDDEKSAEHQGIFDGIEVSAEDGVPTEELP